jgi:hypothetical protein
MVYLDVCDEYTGSKDMMGSNDVYNRAFGM